jgi:hypothetical protein
MMNKIMKLLIITLLLVVTNISLAADNELIRSKCRQTVIDYAHFADTRAMREYANLFTKNGVAIFRDGTFRGPDEIYARFAAMDKNTITRHLMSSIRIIPTGDNTATGISYLHLAIAATAEGHTGPLPAQNLLIQEYHDQFVMQDGNCKFTRRESIPIFVPE